MGRDPKAAPRGWALVRQMLTYWLGLGPDATVAELDVDPRTNTVGDKMLAMVDSDLAEGNRAIRRSCSRSSHRAAR